MAQSKVTGVVITHQWDDESSQEYTVSVHETGQGLRVDIGDGNDLLWIYEDSWPLIREQVDRLLGQSKENN